jgi:hypothetical protein
VSRGKLSVLSRICDQNAILSDPSAERFPVKAGLVVGAKETLRLRL